MGTISSAFAMISGALNADQAALSIVANNVANANTPGYTQETPNWRQNAPIDINGVSLGDGVSETGATSLRDSVLGARLDQQQQDGQVQRQLQPAIRAHFRIFPRAASRRRGSRTGRS